MKGGMKESEKEDPSFSRFFVSVVFFFFAVIFIDAVKFLEIPGL